MNFTNYKKKFFFIYTLTVKDTHANKIRILIFYSDYTLKAQSTVINIKSV